MEQIEEPKQELALPEYVPDYEIMDVVFAEPFVVMKPVQIGRPPWWSDRQKTEALIAAFKMDYTIDEACIQAGITKRQYEYFCQVHPTFVALKARCKRFVGMASKRTIVAAVADPKSAQWYLERRQPEIYGRDIGAYAPPPAAAASKITGEAYLDAEGNVLVSRQTAEVLKQEYGDEDGESKAG